MANRSLRIATLSALCGVVVALPVAFFGLLSPAQAGANAQGDVAGSTAFVVDSTAVPLSTWQADIQNAQSMAPAGTSLPTLRSQLYNAKVEAITSLEEAQKEGLSVSDTEVDTAIAAMQQDYAAAPNSAAIIQKEAAERGVSPADFWSAVRPEVQDMLLIGKLRAKYVTGLGSVSRDQASQDWSTYRASLAQRATTQIVDTAAVTGSN